MQGEEWMGERGPTPGRGGSLWGSSSRHQGQGVARGCGTCMEGPACSRSCPLCAPHPSHHLHGVREQAAWPDHFKGPVLATWPLCFVGRRERRDVCTVGAAAWLCSLCRGLRARDGRMTRMPARPLQAEQSIGAPFLGVEGQSPGQRSLRMQGVITTSLGRCRAG